VNGGMIALFAVFTCASGGTDLSKHAEQWAKSRLQAPPRKMRRGVNISLHPVAHWQKPHIQYVINLIIAADNSQPKARPRQCR
jgi:hypothetical protein